jgi:hypothetical protein
VTRLERRKAGSSLPSALEFVRLWELDMHVMPHDGPMQRG